MKTIEILPNDWIECISECLLHSLWQIPLIYTISIFVVRYGRVKNPGVRFNIYFSALVSCVIAALSTVLIVLNTKTSIFSISEITGLSSMLINETPESSYKSLIINAWFFGLVLLVFRLTFLYMILPSRMNDGLVPNSKLTSILNRYWNINFQGEVRIYESKKVSTPITYGWLKPIILFPIGWVNHLSVEEVSMILKHELAHIARNDYLKNIVINSITVFFYYHPVIWILRRHIDQERESACDQMALGKEGDVFLYSKTLLKVGELSLLNQPKLVMSMTENKNSLKTRIERLFDKKREYKYYPSLLIISFLIIFLMSAYGYSEYNGKRKVEKLELLDKVEEIIELKEELVETPPLVSKIERIEDFSMIVDTLPKIKRDKKRLDVDSMMKKITKEFKNFKFENIDSLLNSYNIQIDEEIYFPDMDSLFSRSYRFNSDDDNFHFYHLDSLMSGANSFYFNHQDFDFPNVDSLLSNSSELYFDGNDFDFEILDLNEDLDHYFDNFQHFNFDADHLREMLGEDLDWEAPELRIEIEDGEMRINGKKIEKERLEDFPQFNKYKRFNSPRKQHMFSKRKKLRSI